jgi:hypothetical protein
MLVACDLLDLLSPEKIIEASLNLAGLVKRMNNILAFTRGVSDNDNFSSKG